MLYLLKIASVKDRLPQFDNSKPREPLLQGPIGRALGAHQNGIEAFLLCGRRAAGGISAGPQHLIDELAVLFLIVRIAYVFTYPATARRCVRSSDLACDQYRDFLLPAIKGICRCR